MAIKLGSMPVGKLHKYAVRLVKASFQSEFYGRVEGILSEDELSILKRGRNAHSATVPKNADPSEYRRATGIESLFGYLYLNGKNERLKEIFDIAINIFESEK